MTTENFVQIMTLNSFCLKFGFITSFPVQTCLATPIYSYFYPTSSVFCKNQQVKLPKSNVESEYIPKCSICKNPAHNRPIHLFPHFPATDKTKENSK